MIILISTFVLEYLEIIFTLEVVFNSILSGIVIMELY